MIDFDVFKQQIKKAAHENKSCVKGYREMMEAENYTQMLNVMKDNWDWVYNGGFYNLFRDNFGAWYDGHEDQFHAAQVYYNEESTIGHVFISSPEKVVTISGRAMGFVLKASDLDVYGHAEVHCRAQGSLIRLYESAYGIIDEGTCDAYGYSQAVVKDTVNTYEHSTAFVNNGRCYDYAHDRIQATGKSVVYSDNPYHITLQDESVLKPFPEFL